MPVQRTAPEVIAIFTDLGLPVCDDWPAIKAKIDTKRARYLRDCNSPDTHVSKRAKAWFEEVSDLEKTRADLLKTVYQFFHDQARVALDAALASGVKTLTPQLHASLRDLALKQCKTDAALTDKFLDDFYKQYGITVGPGGGGSLINVPPLTAFTATNGFGQIELKWTLPATDCDEVEILRDERTGPRTIYRGRGTSFIDRGVTGGVWYTYHGRVNYRGSSGLDATQRALCLGEVTQAAAVWRDGQIHLSWVVPGGPSTSVLVFRREGMPPTVRIDPTGVRPADPTTTQQVYAGSSTSWTDTDLKEGSTYFYRIIADFGPGMYGQGVEVQATVPRPLPPVPGATATYQCENGKDVVHLKWDTVSASVPVRYTVVRREGATPPARLDDGVKVLTAGDQASCRDDPPDASGKRFTYGVFTVSGDRVSRTAAPAGPVAILTEVGGVKSQVGDGVVELEWTPPARATSVVVRRSLNPPRDPNDGVPVRASSPTNARDVGLKNGQRYHYLVCCGYRPDGGTELFSPGVRLAAVPEKPPEPIKPLTWRVHQKQIEFTWEPPAHGQPVLLRCAQPPGLPTGKRLSAAELSKLGTRIQTGAGQAIDPSPDVNAPHYLLATVAGDQAVIGDTQMALAIPDVSDLTLSAEKDGALLRWTWPDDCQSVRVSRRVDAWPTGPDDPKAVHKTCTLDEYRNAGNKFLDTLQSARGLLHYVVYAQSSALSGRHFSSGTDAGSRTSVQWESWMTIAYRLMESDVKDADGLKMLWRFKVETPFPAFKGLVLVANEQRIPDDDADGVVLSRWQRKPDQGPGEWQIKVALKPVQQRGWAQFYCKAFPLDPAQGLTTLMIHPNPCVPVMANGRVDLGKVRPPEHRTRAAGPPGNVICPLCFERFGPEKILYTDAKGGTAPQPAQWSVMDRMLGKPPQPPRDSRGHKLDTKLCPFCKKQLPNTAGALDSLIIGLVGAKYSGKSHYVASLVQRLQAQASLDLHASMLHVTDETLERYRREFHDPLYKNREELPVTVGSPPPLVYNLQFDGRLYHEEQGRAVTLSLYDTAGENFNQKDVLQRTVKYLSVASGLMFLVDPLQLDVVREALQFSPVNLPARADPTEIIQLVLNELEERDVLKRGGKMTIPVAVVLTKADMLRDAGLIAPNRLWCTDKRHVGRFDLQAHLDMSGMVGESVQRWHPALYSLVTGRFERHAFFAASSTGCASDRKKEYKFIAPWRVEDPMVWLLAELGMVPTR